MLQQLIIGAAVLVAAAYVVWSFMSMHRRQWLLDGLARHGLLVRWAAKHRARLATPGCGICSAAAEHGKSAPR